MSSMQKESCHGQESTETTETILELQKKIYAEEIKENLNIKYYRDFAKINKIKVNSIQG